MNQQQSPMSAPFMSPDFAMYNAAAISRLPMNAGLGQAPSNYPWGSNMIPPWAQMAQIQQQNHSQSSTFNLPMNSFPQPNQAQGVSQCSPPSSKVTTSQSEPVLPSGTPPVEVNTAGEEKLVLVLTTASRIEQNYKVALDGLNGIDGVPKETWKTYYFIHKSRIDAEVSAQLGHSNILRARDPSPVRASSQQSEKVKASSSPAPSRKAKSSKNLSNVEYKDPISLSTRAKNPLNITSRNIEFPPAPKRRRGRIAPPGGGRPPKRRKADSSSDSDDSQQSPGDKGDESTSESESSASNATPPPPARRRSSPHPASRNNRKGASSESSRFRTRFPDINTDLPSTLDEANMAEENEPYTEADIRLFAKFIAEHPEMPVGQIAALFHERYPTRNDFSAWKKVYTRYEADLKPLVEIYKGKLSARNESDNVRDIQVSKDLKKHQVPEAIFPPQRDPFSSTYLKTTIHRHQLPVDSYPEGPTFYQPHPDTVRSSLRT